MPIGTKPTECGDLNNSAHDTSKTVQQFWKNPRHIVIGTKRITLDGERNGTQPTPSSGDLTGRRGALAFSLAREATQPKNVTRSLSRRNISARTVEHRSSADTR